MRHLWMFGAMLVAGLVYGLTLGPFVQAGDSGEMVVAAARLKVLHPPGYPLYVYLAHAFSWLPFSTVAWRIGFFSLVAQVLTVALLFEVLNRWLKAPLWAFVVSLFYAFSPLVWTYATQAEVFALNNLLVMLCVWLVQRYSQTRREYLGYLACLCSGLAFSHHQTSVFVCFPLLAFYLWRDRARWMRVHKVLLGLLLFAVGLTPWLLLFELGKEPDLLSWGDFSNWTYFWQHVFRAEYGTFRLSSSGDVSHFSIEKFAAFAAEMAKQGAGFGLVAVLVTGRALWSRRPWTGQTEFAAALFFAFLFYALIFNLLLNVNPAEPLLLFITLRMWLLPVLLMWLVTGFALAEVVSGKKWAPAAFVVGLILLTGYHWRFQDESGNDVAESVARASLRNVEPGALVFMRGDAVINSLRYVQTVLGVRPDVHLVPLDMLSHPWAKAVVAKAVPGILFPEDVPAFVNSQSRTFVELVLANLDHFAVYLPELNPIEQQMTAGRLEGFIVGFHTKIKRPGAGWTFEELERETAPFLELNAHLQRPGHTWEHFFFNSIPEYQLAIGASFAARAGQDGRFLQKGIQTFNGVAETTPQLRSLALLQIAFLYSDLTAGGAEWRTKAIEAWRKYRDDLTVGADGRKTASENLKRLGVLE